MTERDSWRIPRFGVVHRQMLSRYLPSIWLGLGGATIVIVAGLFQWPGVRATPTLMDDVAILLWGALAITGGLAWLVLHLKIETNAKLRVWHDDLPAPIRGASGIVAFCFAAAYLVILVRYRLAHAPVMLAPILFLPGMIDGGYPPV